MGYALGGGSSGAAVGEAGASTTSVITVLGVAATVGTLSEAGTMTPDAQAASG